MADGILTVTGFGDFRKLHAEYNKLNAKTAEMERKLKDLTAQSKKNDRAQNTTIDTMARKATSMIATYASVKQAIQLVNQAIREQIELQTRALGSSTTLANAQVELSSSLGPRATDAQRASMIQMFQNLGVSSGFGEADMLRAASVGFSATSGAVNQQRASRIAEVLSAANPMFRAPDAKANLGDFAGVALNVQDAIPGMTGTEAVDVLTALRGQARITDTGKIKNLVPAIISDVGAARFYGAGQGQSKENALQMASLVAKLGQMIADDTGELSRTGGILFGEVVREFAPEGMKDMPILDLAEQIAKGPEPIRQKIVSELKGRGVTKIPQQGFLDFADRVMARQDSRSIRPELEVGFGQGRDFREFNVRGTPELARVNNLRVLGASQEKEVRDRFADAATVRATLFGGDIGGEQIEGEFNRNIGRGGNSLVDIMRKWAMRAVFELGSAGNTDTEDVATRTILMDALLQRGVGGYSDETISSTLEMLRAVRDVSQDTKDASKNAIHAQNAAAASSQRNAQQE